MSRDRFTFGWQGVGLWKFALQALVCKAYAVRFAEIAMFSWKCNWSCSAWSGPAEGGHDVPGLSRFFDAFFGRGASSK